MNTKIAGMAEQRQVLDKAYENIRASKVMDRPIDKPVQEVTTASVEVPQPDFRDNVHVWVQTYIPDPIYYLILISGAYAVFHKPVNSFLTQILGFNLDDLKQTVRRRRERDRELNDDIK